MDLKQIKPKLIGSDDKRAVSPVIGVILMVAVTVILAAVIAAAVMGMGDNIGGSSTTLDASISANSDYDATSGSEIAYVNHRTGDTIANGNILVNVRNQDGASIASIGVGETASVDGANGEVEISTSGDFDAGSTITVQEAGTDSLAGSDLDTGNTVVIQVIDTSSDTMVVESEVNL